jgi:hypothetical protein
LKSIEFLSDEVWARISDLAREADSRQAAVAYVGSNAVDLLPLGKGDTLIVDMSVGVVRSGATNPALIRRYVEKGVIVHSFRGLHAKVFVFDDTAVVGSTNVSTNSQSVLTEAAVFTTEPSAVSSCRDFIEGLANQGELVTPEILKLRNKLYRKPKWTPGAGILPRESRDNWEYKVMAALGEKPGYRPRHGHFIDLSAASDAIGTAYLHLDSAASGAGAARLNLYPADVIRQARPFYTRVDIARLMGLAARGWQVSANFHFGRSYGAGLPPYVTQPPIRLRGYLQFWKSHPERMRRVQRKNLMKEIRNLQKQKILPPDLPQQELKNLRGFANADIRPGMSLVYRWPAFDKLPSPAAFAPKVRAAVDQALAAWGESF